MACNRSGRGFAPLFIRSTAIGLFGLLAFAGTASAQTFTIDRAEYSVSDGVSRVRVEGNGQNGRTVTITNAGNGALLGTTTIDDGEWDRRFRGLSPIPCRVRATDGSTTRELAVSRAPANCGPVAGAPTLPAISIAGVTQNEGTPPNATTTSTTTMTFTVTLAAPAPTGGVTFNFATANGTALAGTDYVATSGSRTIAAGGTSATIPVTVNADTAVENNETFTVNISAATNTSNQTASATGTITNDDAAPPPVNPTLSIGNVSQNEGNTGTSTMTFTVQLSAAAPAGGVSFNVATANGTATAGSDYVAIPSTARTIAAGQTSTTIVVTINGDTTNEANETFNVNLSNITNTSNGATASAIGTITNDDAAPPPNATFSINDVTVAEGGTANFTVTRAGTTTTAVSVVASTATGTAVAADFTARTNVTLNFAAGVTTQTFAVVTLADALTTEANESFNVNLSAPTGGTITDALGVGTITNVVTPPLVCDPVANATNPNGSHVGCFTNPLTNALEYTGPAQCVACHEADARNMHGSLHYQQNAIAPNVTNINAPNTPTASLRKAGEGPAGRPSGVDALIAINTYCGTHENSPRFTCAGCHVGNGRFPKTPTEMAALPLVDQRTELANIDCLMCHQETYKRFPDWLTSNDNPAGTSAGFSNLTLENVCLNSAGALIDATIPANQPLCVQGPPVVRTGFAGIPNVDSLTLDFQFRPAGAAGSVLALPAGVPLPGGAMALTTEQAAERVHRTTRNTCLNCHANAGAADGAKRGDISSANRNSTDVTIDRHMANAAGGSNMTCSSCHNVDDTPTVNDTGRQTTHRMRGRGLDLRANDSTIRLTCDSGGCHNAATVHNAVTNGTQITRHNTKVACQTCHIPRYGKGVATEVSRDWQKPHVTQTACNGRGGWLPEEIKSSTATPPVALTPTYQWFDGTSQIYYLTETLANTPRKALPANIATAFGMPTTTQAYVMGRPNPNPENATTRVTGAGNNAAKIYPMKEHWGKLARNVSVNNPDVPVNSLVPQSTFEFFRTGSFCRAVATGLGQNPDTVCGTNVQNKDAPPGTEVVAVHTYQTLNHGVEPQAASLGANNTCGSCHDVPISPFTTGKPLRMNLQRDMGYAVTRAGLTEGTNGNWSCSPSCHGNQSGNFTNIHSRSQHQNAGCNACHSAITGR